MDYHHYQKRSLNKIFKSKKKFFVSSNDDKSNSIKSKNFNKMVK